MTATAILEKLLTNQKWLERGILAIDARQTSDEVADKTTKHQNGRGWSSADASKGTYFASYLRAGKHLSGKFVEDAQKLMRRYAGQLARIVAEKQAQ